MASLIAHQQADLPLEHDRARFATEHAGIPRLAQLRQFEGGATVEDVLNDLGSEKLAYLGSKKPFASQEYDIIDIRQDKSCSFSTDLRSECLRGLTEPPSKKYLPSLLLWDGEGPGMYNDILKTRHYYPVRVETGLLELRIQEIATQIRSSGTQALVELGAGSMQKTAPLLLALGSTGIAMDYYGLDVDRSALEESLAGLASKVKPSCQNIRIHGLLGTYEDGANWLGHAEEARHSRKSLMWLGSSIANLLPDDAGALMRSFTRNQSLKTFSGFLVSVDGCLDRDLIECAYDTPLGQSRKFMKYALTAARARLGPDAAELLDDDNWRIQGKWNADSSCYENWVSAAKPLSAVVLGRNISIQRGERVHILRSGKWSQEKFSEICGPADLQVARGWSSSEVDYCIYWLQLQQSNSEKSNM